MSRRRRKRRGLPRAVAPYVSNRYTMRQVRWLLQCEAKESYPDKRTAKRARDAIFERTDDWMGVYKCRVSGINGKAAHYHLGHSRPRYLVMQVWAAGANGEEFDWTRGRSTESSI